MEDNPLMVLSYPGWEKDKEVAEQYFAIGSNTGPGSLFYKKIEAMKCKEKLHNGDRTHPDIMLLDSAEFTYPDSSKDREDCEKCHIGDCSSIYLGAFQQKFQLMCRRQAIHSDRQSFPDLQKLDSMELTYHDWETDAAVAERLFVESPLSQLFHKKIAAMTVKQALSEGDRSNPDIVSLDNAEFTYKGYEFDAKEAMLRVTGDCSVLCLGKFEEKFNEMKRKQQAWVERSTVEELQYLESLQFTYSDFLVDKKCAERLFLEFGRSSNASSSLFQKKVNGMKVKQMIHEGQSHPDILALDSIQLTYPDADRDRENARKQITGDCSISRLGDFQQTLAEMRNKQAMYNNRDGLQSLDCVLPSNLNAATIHSDPQGVGTDRELKKSETLETDALSIASSVDEEPDPKHSKENNGCVVCLEQEATHAFIPCGHLCICSSCLELMDTKCPLCRRQMFCVTRIYK